MKSSESLLGISVAALSGVVRAFVFVLLLLLAAPAAAGAATVSVAPYVEPPLPPGDDGFGSCGRYAQCPADMVVFSAAAGEANRVTITLEAAAGFRQLRIVVREEGFPPSFPPCRPGRGASALTIGRPRALPVRSALSISAMATTGSTLPQVRFTAARAPTF